MIHADEALTIKPFKTGVALKGINPRASCGDDDKFYRSEATVINAAVKR